MSVQNAGNMKAILLVTSVMIGVIVIFIKIPLMILFGIYGIIAISPWIIVFLKKDLTNGLLIWILLVLFSRAIGQVNLPMLPDVSLYRIMWILLILAFLVQIAFRERDFLPITKIEILMILFCIICLISMIKAGTIFDREQGLMLRNFLNGYAIPFSIFFLSKHIVDNEQKIKKIFQFLLIIGIYLALTGIFEHFHFSTLIFPKYIMDPNVGIHWGRARGPFLMAPANGAALGMALFPSIYVVMHMHSKLSRIFYGIFICMIPLTIFFTYTRACWLGFIISVSVIPIFYPKVRKVFFLGLFIIVIIYIFNWSNVMSKDRSAGGITEINPIYDRINLYGASLRMFLEKPLFGFGLDTFEKISPFYFHKIKGVPFVDLSSHLGAHDTLVSTLAELGLVGFIPLLIIFFYIFRHSIRLFRRLPSNPFLGKGLLAIFWGTSIVYIVIMQFNQMRHFIFLNSLFFLLAGIVVGLNQRALLNEEALTKSKEYRYIG